jgi:hypothetical protein
VKYAAEKSAAYFFMKNFQKNAASGQKTNLKLTVEG